jgi:endonuclease-8
VPEGDTLYRAARALAKVLEGKPVTRFETAYAKLASVNDDRPVAGRTIEKVESRGKWLLMYFSGDLILASHMLMSGSWHIYRTGERWLAPRKAMRIVLEAEGWQAVAFNVPVAEFHTAASLARSTQIPSLGPDILSPLYTADIGLQRLEERAQSHPEDEIANVLLNQRILAGLGNVYKSEVCFAARVHPFRTMRTLTRDEMQQMADIAQRYMQANVLEGTGEGIVTYTGNRRTTHAANGEDRLWVYGRRGKECRRCGATIEMRKQGTGARSTYWCPSCQPWIGNGEAPQGWNTPITRNRTGS